MENQIQSVAIIGAGKLGVVLAQLAIKAGYSVNIAGSGDPDKIALSMRVLVPGAQAMTSEAAIRTSDIVVLALPLNKYRELPVDVLSGKLVIDATNYWWEVDGNDPHLAGLKESTSELIQLFLSGAHVVKALSHMSYQHLADGASSNSAAYDSKSMSDHPDDLKVPRRKFDKAHKAIAIAGDRPEDTGRVAEFVDRLGFDPLVIGPLATGKRLEPGNPAFGANMTKSELAQLINNPNESHHL